MKYDMLIKNGTVIDPAAGLHAVMDVAISGNKIMAVGKTLPGEVTSVIDAQGLVVTPGLIDFHTHVFYGGTDIGVSPDMAFLPLGVTTAVDAGSAGSANYTAFSSGIVAQSLVRIKSFLNVCPSGLSTTKYHENVAPACYDTAKMERILDRYQGEILGLKIRTSKEIVGDAGLEPLRQTIALAERFNLPVAVHTTNPPEDAGCVAALLRKGDIYVHVYQGTGDTIIGTDGKVKQAVWEARKRGVIFDAANGGNHWTYAVARAALCDSFFPDVISTDITTKTLYKAPVYGLPYIMSKYLNLGMPLESIIAACTAMPAKLMGLQGKIGTLQAGAYADLAIFSLEKSRICFPDTKGETMTGTQLLIPKMTVKDGLVVYKDITLS